MVNSGQKTANWVYCVGLFALAFLLRAYASDYGYFHGDERINDAARVLAGQLVPGQHFYPPFLNYVLAVVFAGLYVFGLLTDMWSSTAEFRQAYFDDPTPFYVAARYLTAAIGALMAPIAFAIAKRVGLRTGGALTVGAIAALFPLSVYMGHIAKGDTGLAVTCLAVLWALIARVQTDRPARWNIVVGVLVAVAVSFKQSAVFFLVPMGVFSVVVLARAEGAARALRSFGASVLVAALLWPVLNLGTLLDIDGFLAFQQIQAVMSIQEQDGTANSLRRTLAIFGDVEFGLNPVFLAMTVVVPVWLVSGACRLKHWDMLLAAWLAALFSTLVVSVITGTRQPEHLFFIQLLVLLVLTAVALLDMLRCYSGLPRLVIAMVIAVGLGLSGAATRDVLRQAAAVPASVTAAQFLRQTYPDRHIQSSIALPVPRTRGAQQMIFARYDRLGAKYQIEMPPIAPERVITKDTPNALFWIDTPFSMSGLEGDDVDAADYKVEPHAWPLQPEEWALDYWLEQGVDLFLVNQFEHQLHDSRSSLIRAFHAEIQARCTLVREFAGQKPIFDEFDLTLFDCRGA